MANTIDIQNISSADCRPIPTATEQFILVTQITVGTTCVLSVLGASLIILTYVLFKDLRTTARLLLVNLSVADIFVAGSHFVGILTNYRRFLTKPCKIQSNDVTASDAWCATQGGFTMFGTIASFLWTIGIAIYLLVIIVLRRPVAAKRLAVVLSLLCWGIPAALTIAFGVSGYLGFEENVDVGWCYLKRVDESNSTNSTSNMYTGTETVTHHRNVLPQVLGYEMWVYLTLLCLPVLYIWIRCHVRIKWTRVNGRPSVRMQARAGSADLKLIFVPLIFLLLRMWNGIIDIVLFYMSEETRLHFRGTILNAVFVALAGVGNSAQGLANAILFCLFTKLVRQKLLLLLKCQHSVCRSQGFHWLPMSSTNEVEDDTTDYGGSEDSISDDKFPELIVNADSKGLHVEDIATEDPLYES